MQKQNQKGNKRGKTREQTKEGKLENKKQTGPPKKEKWKQKKFNPRTGRF